MTEEAALDKRALSRLKGLGIEHADEVLTLVPRRYDDLSVFAPGMLELERTGERGLLRLRSLSSARVKGEPGRVQRITLRVSDGHHEGFLTAFGYLAPWRDVRAGEIIHVLGRINRFRGSLNVKDPERIADHMLGRLIARYPGREGVVHPDTVAGYINRALQAHRDATCAYLRERLQREEGEILALAGGAFASLDELITTLHRPENAERRDQALAAARQINALGALLGRGRASEPPACPESAIAIPLSRMQALAAALPFTPTRDQRRAMWEIYQDLTAPRPMDRVLTGDVGSGKTLAYALPAVAAHREGAQVVVMMPNTLLAEQVAGEIEALFPGTPVMRMVAGHEHAGPLDAPAIVVGTSAILAWAGRLPEPLRVDLLIMDEQQKFGTRQRDALCGSATNRLEASATPIPRTMALMHYAEKSVSRLREQPVRKAIRTRIAGPSERARVMAAIEATLERGGKVAVLYPTREGENRIAAAAAPGDDERAREALLEALRGARGVTRIEALDEAGARHFPEEAPLLASGALRGYRFRLAAESEEALRGVLAETPGVRWLGGIDSGSAVRSVEQAAERFERRFPGRVGVIHGGLSAEDKRERITRAKAGDYDVLVTTSVLEIGVTIPELRMLYIVDASRFGANTLHQIRGRIARQGGRGLFVMGIERELGEVAEKTRRRLELIGSTNDGFEIAEGELRERGMGDISRAGLAQSGFAEALFAGLGTDIRDIEAIHQRLLGGQKNTPPKRGGARVATSA